MWGMGYAYVEWDEFKQQQSLRVTGLPRPAASVQACHMCLREGVGPSQASSPLPMPIQVTR